MVGISNSLHFVDDLDPRVRSSLSEEELVFPPYNALQIQDILRDRATHAFRKGAVAEGVIEKCAAYAAREHGDARRALELLRVSGEIAEREGKATVETEHVDKSEEKIDRDRFFEIINGQPKHHQLVLHSILGLHPQRPKNIFTGEIYTNYKNKCTSQGLRPLTQRRVSDIIAEFDMLGLINAKVISKGRYGRTREVSLTIPQQILPKIQETLNDQLNLR